ncbi:MAG: hypothetical protein AAF560_34035, partial [Acidobacteriota bacterium]
MPTIEPRWVKRTERNQKEMEEQRSEALQEMQEELHFYETISHRPCNFSRRFARFIVEKLNVSTMDIAVIVLK